MRIPTWGDGAAPAPVQHTRIGNPAGAVAEATDRLAGIAGNIAQHELAQQADEAQALAVAKAANARTAHRIEVDALANDVAGRVQRGEVPYEEAEKVYDTEAADIEAPDLHLPPAVAETYHGEVSNNRLAGRKFVESAVKSARRDDGKAQFAAALDLGAKEAAAPGADVDAINRKIEQWAPIARQFGLPEDTVSKAIQTFKDNNWMNAGTQMLLNARNDQPALDKLITDLSAADGFFAARLDPEKRNVLLGRAIDRREALQRQVDTLSNKAETKAERAVNFLADANATGIPVLPEKILELQATVAGTSHAQEFADQLAIGQEVAKVRRLPFAQQQQYADQLQQELNRGSADPKRDQTRLNTLRNALESSRKLAAESPLIFYQNQGGDTVQPIDFSAIGTPAGVNAVSDQLADRYDILAALRKQYGPEVAMNPWRPEEAGALKQVLAQTHTDDAKLVILSALARNAPSVKAYRDTLAPIAQSDPAAFLAGQEEYLKHRAGKNGPLGPIILQGAKVFADKSVALPTDDKFRVAFEEEAGAAFEPGTPQRDEAYNRFRYIYAGLVNKLPAGRVDENKDLDETLRTTAINLATSVTEYQGRKTIKPFGWTENQFHDSINLQLRDTAKATGYPLESLQALPLLQLPGREGEYFLLSGSRPLPDKTSGTPLILRLSKVAPTSVQLSPAMQDEMNSRRADLL